jgi:Uma2 family endonuclease
MLAMKTARFTRADYMKLPEGFRAELIEGELVREPAPTQWHQAIAGWIHVQLAALVGPRRVVESPIDLFVDDECILQPDVAVLPESAPARPDIPEMAVPLLVVEVLSPSSIPRDRRRKPSIYFRAGVREVWIVNPADETAEILTPEGTRWFAAPEHPRSGVLPGFALDLAALFAV